MVTVDEMVFPFVVTLIGPTLETVPIPPVPATTEIPMEPFPFVIETPLPAVKVDFDRVFPFELPINN